MVSRIPWDEKETVLLIDACVSIKNKEISRDEAVKGLSRTLKMRAEYIGIEIDDMFRNENGISMQLSLIERLMDESESGFNHYSKMFANMVNLYKKSPAQFEEILIKAKEEECKSVQKAFFDWLSTKVSTSMLSLYKNTSIDLESFCNDNKILSESIFKITNLDDINNLVSKIENKIKFSYKYLNKADKFLKLVNYYIEFIKETILYGESSVVIDERSKEEKDIVSFIKAEKISYSDERIKNGPVWIFGGIEAKQFVAKMKDKGVAFVFGYCGGVAGWWTRNYNVKILVEEDTAEVCPDVVDEDTAEVCPDVVDEDTAEVYPDVVDEDTAEVCPDVVEKDTAEVCSDVVEKDTAEVCSDVVEKDTELTNEESKFCDVYSLNMEEYRTEFIRSSLLSHKTKVVCRQGRIFTIAELLDYSMSDFRKVYGVNDDVIREVNGFLKGLNKTLGCEIFDEEDSVAEVNLEEVQYLEDKTESDSEHEDLTLCQNDVLEREISNLEDVHAELGCASVVMPISSCKVEQIEMNDLLDEENEFVSDDLNQCNSEEALNENKTFAEIYNLKPSDYDYIDVKSAMFSIRVEKRLIQNDIDSIEKLLEACPSTIKSFNGIGNNSIKEIEDYFAKLKTSSKEFFFEGTIPQYINDIFGDELVEKFCNNGKRCVLSNYLKLMNEELNRSLSITETINKIPTERLALKAYGFILAYNYDRAQLLSLLDDKEEILCDYLGKIRDKIIHNELSSLYMNFIKWLSFDIKDDIDTFFSKLFAKDRIDKLLLLRANNHTFEEVGNELGITRARAQQIESKVAKSFIALNNQYRLLQKIYAIRNGDTVLTVDEINSYLGKYSAVFLYLIKKFNYNDITYNKKLDVFIIADDTLDERVIEYVEQLPDVFSLEELEMFYDYAEKDFNINSEILGQTISEYYNLVGSTYSRKKMNRYDILISCVQEYFPNGIHVSDDNQINELRKIVFEKFGDINLADNNRAIASRLMDKCVLRDRGTYIAKRQSYISNELADKIFNYINDSKHTVFYILSLFIKFKKDLLKEGVDNRYFLHGILKELYYKDFYFKRDCLSKDSLFVDPYGRENSALKELCLNIIDFIGQRKYPVQKKEIYENFPDISEFVIYNVISSKEVINYSGSYLHTDYIKFYEDEYLRVKSILSEVVSDDKVHHISEIFNVINREIPEFLTRNFALNQYGCFSLLNYIYNGEFNFYRPYVSKLGIEIASVTQRLHDFVYSNDVIKITEINNFAKENSYQIPSLMQYLKSCNDEFFLISHNEIMKIDRIGITKDIAMIVEDILCEEVTKTLPIYELTSLYKLPRIAVPWDEWLLFSVINKWGSKLSVATTSNQFRHAVPIIAPAGELDEDLYKDLTRTNVGDTWGETDIIDSLDSDNLDELLDDLMDDIWEDDL